MALLMAYMAPLQSCNPCLERMLIGCNIGYLVYLMGEAGLEKGRSMRAKAAELQQRAAHH